MSIEIERKFLVERPPPEVDRGTGQRLRQGYLAEDGDVEVRVRITDSAALLTVKAGRGLSRTEVETQISVDDAQALWPHTGDRRIEKARFRIPVGGGIAELDVYEGALAGLFTVEVEFPSEGDASAFEPPAWFGREVTDDDRWTNAALARHGRPT